MNFFESASLRLKLQLGTSLDKDVAAALKISPRAWAGRKRSGAFPELELRALAQQRPDFEIDVDYVLFGVKTAQRQAQASAVKSPNDFEAKLTRLVELLGVNDDQDVAALLRMTKAAFSARKTRGVFPEEKLYVLAATRPDLKIDVDYVLFGADGAGESAITEHHQALNRHVPDMARGFEIHTNYGALQVPPGDTADAIAAIVRMAAERALRGARSNAV